MMYSFHVLSWGIKNTLSWSEQHSLQCSEPRTNPIGYKCSYSSESKCLKCWKKRCCFWHKFIWWALFQKMQPPSSNKKAENFNVKYIRNKRYKSHGHKCYKGPESNGKRCFFHQPWLLAARYALIDIDAQSAKRFANQRIIVLSERSPPVAPATTANVVTVPSTAPYTMAR